MANKILLKHKGDVDDYYEPSDSENDYTEREKKLIQKVRKGRQRNVDPEQELLAFDQQEDSDEEEDYDDDFDEKFEADSDIDDEDDDGIPDARAWGNKRRDFHSTDFIDQDHSSYNQREEESAEQEEAEARSIQQRLAKQFDEADFALDVFTTAEPKLINDKKEESGEIFMKKDLSQMSQRQKEQLFKKESPEFESLVQDFRQRLNDSIELLEPILEYFKVNSIENHPFIEFIKNQHQLILNYCTNVSFYLVLKAKRIPIQNHPIIKRLVKIRQLLLQVDEKYTDIIKPQAEALLKAIKEGTEIIIDTSEEATGKKPKKKLRFVENLDNGATDSGSDKESETSEHVDKEDDLESKQKLKLFVNSESEQENADEEIGDGDDEEIGDEDERRQITYQIAKNKGLTPYRKKELRNPRVKHRNKFRKALIRRKGAHRTVRKEIKRYDGEKFGIKATVKKGIKIK